MIDLEKYDSGQAFCDDLLDRHREFTLTELAQCASRLCAMAKYAGELVQFGEHCEDVLCPRCGRRTVYYMRGFVMGCLADSGGCGAKPRVKKEEVIPPHPENDQILMAVLR